MKLHDEQFSPAPKFLLAKSGHMVPVVAGHPLHSLEDPIQEAREWAKKYLSTANNENNFLILGLGGGFHISALTNLLVQRDSRPFTVAVIEPSAELASYHEDHQSPFDTRVRVFCDSNPLRLHEDEEHLRFLLMKPSICPHPQSVVAEKKFYEEYLSVRQSNKLADIRRQIKNPELAATLEHCPDEIEWSDLVNHLKNQKRPLAKDDLFFLALDEMAKYARTPEEK
jgi:hypothetical protein